MQKNFMSINARSRQPLKTRSILSDMAYGISMKIKLNKSWYICPVIEDHTGERGGRYPLRQPFQTDLHVESETDQFWTGKFPTYYEGKPGGWLRVELLKECFDVLEDE
jgi:hypothetical protein